MIDTKNLHTSDKILTLSNSISFLRILLAIPTVFYFLRGGFAATGLMMVFAYITDLLDGYIARKTNSISEFGKAIDPIADKIFVAALIIAMLSRNMVPLWFVLIVIGKDLLTMFGAFIARNKIGAVLPSNYWGKSAILLTIICLFLAVCGVSKDILVFGWIASSALLIISFLIYAIRALKLIKKTNEAKG
jgi:CDP-diacylglycerol--glycerol-3-phosphate 3-phosphatidyltransferase